MSPSHPSWPPGPEGYVAGTSMELEVKDAAAALEEVRSSGRVICEQLQLRAHTDLPDAASHLDDWSRALHSATVQRQSLKGGRNLVHVAPTVARISATIGGRMARN